MKSTTASIAELYRRTLTEAAGRDSSVSAMMRELLANPGTNETDPESRKRLQDDVLATVRHFRGGQRLTRDAIYRHRPGHSRK